MQLSHKPNITPNRSARSLSTTRAASHLPGYSDLHGAALSRADLSRADLTGADHILDLKEQRGARDLLCRRIMVVLTCMNKFAPPLLV